MDDDPIIDDPFPVTPMMGDSLIEEFGVEGTLVILYRELEQSTRNTDIFARQQIRTLITQIKDRARQQNEEVSVEQKQKWLIRHGFEDTIQMALTHRYIDYSGGDNSNGGASAGDAWQTISHAYSTITKPIVGN